ncbi:hypothetical protein WN943_018955 [Citrus x changshan-huyou]
MDTEKLMRRCKSITLKEEEEDAVLDVNKDGLRYAMQQAWKTTKEIKVESLGDNIFVFKFAVEHDKKRVLTEGPWHFDKALIVLVEPLKLNNGKTIKSKRDDQPDAATRNTGVQIQTQPKPKKQLSNPNPSKHDGSCVTQMDNPNEEMSVEVTYVAEVGEESLMKAAKESRQSYLEYRKLAVAVATIGEIHRAESKTKGNSGRKVKLDAVRNGERNMGMMGQQGKNENQTQGFSISKEFNFEPTKPNSQSKSRKWKTQARDSNHTTKMTSGPTSVKMSCSELDWPSPESKRLKNVNPQKTPISPKLKLAWETKGKANESDTVQQMEKSAAEAGN